MYNEDEVFKAMRSAALKSLSNQFKNNVRNDWNVMLQTLPSEMREDPAFMKTFMNMRPQFMVDEERAGVESILSELNEHGVPPEEWAEMPTAQKLLEHKRLGNEPPTFKIHVVLDGEHMDSDLSIRLQLWELLNKQATLILTSGDAIGYLDKPVPLFDQGGNRCGTMSLDWS